MNDFALDFRCKNSSRFFACKNYQLLFELIEKKSINAVHIL